MLISAARVRSLYNFCRLSKSRLSLKFIVTGAYLLFFLSLFLHPIARIETQNRINMEIKWFFSVDLKVIFYLTDV